MTSQVDARNRELGNHDSVSSHQFDSSDSESFHEPTSAFQNILSQWENPVVREAPPTPNRTAAVPLNKVDMLTRRLNRIQARSSFDQRCTESLSIAESTGTHGTHQSKKMLLRQPKNVYQKPLPQMIDTTQPDSGDVSLISADDDKAAKPQHSGEDGALLLKALRKNFVFGGCSEEELRSLVKAFELCSFSKGTDFVRQGDVADYFYVLQSGSLHFLVDGTIVDKLAGAGATFGELALLYTTTRSATVRAAKDSTLFRVDQKAFRAVLQAQSEAAIGVKVELLKNVRFLKALPTDDLKRVAVVLEPRIFRPDQVLIEEDQQTDFWLIQSGKVARSSRLNATKYQDQTLGPGEFFGERSLTVEEKSSSTFTALSKGVAFVTSRSKLETVLGSLNRMLTKGDDVELLERIDYIRKGRLDALQLATVSSLISPGKSFSAKKTIFKKGAKIQPALYFVRSGKVEVTNNKGESVTIAKGGYFGEDLMKSDESKTKIRVTCESTAIVRESCVCGILTLRDCRTVFDTDAMAAMAAGGGLPTDESEIPLVDEFDAPPSPLKKSSNIPQLFPKITEETMAVISPKQKCKPKKKLAPPRPKIRVVVPRTPRGFRWHTVLGEGTFGQVWMVTNRKCKTKEEIRPFALKIQSKSELINEGQVQAVLREKELMEKLKHPFIIRQYKTYQDEGFLYTVLEFIQGGELFSLLHTEEEDKVRLPETQVQFYALAIADALACIHRLKIAYRDLKPENIMIDNRGYPVLIDFGFAKVITDKTYTLCGTPG